MEDAHLMVGGYRLVCTSTACPEQYDVLNADGTQVAYLRLRHGYFRADVPAVGGDTVYEAHTRGDGTFDTDERMPQLEAAIAAVKDWHLKLLAEHSR